MNNFISILRDANSPEELEELKVMLFKENVNLKTERADIEDEWARLKEREEELDKKILNAQKELEDLEKKKDIILKEIEEKQNKLEKDNAFLQKKQSIIESSYNQLDKDRLQVKKERELLNRRLAELATNYNFDNDTSFFKGVSSDKDIKKRYKELIKVFHPDNGAGDSETLDKINKEYESLKSGN